MFHKNISIKQKYLRSIGTKEWTTFLKNGADPDLLKLVIPEEKISYISILSPKEEVFEAIGFERKWVISYLKPFIKYLSPQHFDSTVTLPDLDFQNLQLAIDMVLDLDNFDHHSYYNLEAPEDIIPENKTLWYDLVHLRVSLLQILANIAVQQGNTDMIKEAIEKTFNSVISTNKCFAPCLNNSLSSSLAILFVAFPKYTSSLILERISNINHRIDTPSPLSTDNLQRDHFHFIRSTLRSFRSLHKTLFSHIQDTTLWNQSLLEENQKLLGGDERLSFYDSNKDALIQLVQKMFSPFLT